MFAKLRYMAGEGSIAWRGLQTWKSWSGIEQSPHQHILQLQSGKLDLLLTAARRAPFWRSSLVEEPGRMQGETLREQLSRLPILTKAIVRQEAEKMLPNGSNSRGLEWCRTGGSTGEPLSVARDLATRSAVMAACIRGFGWHNVNPGDATVHARGFDRLSWLGELRCLAGNFRIVDPFKTPSQPRKRIGQIIRKFKPRCLVGYPTSLLKLTTVAEMEHLHVPVIFSTGEMLYPDQRERLKASFKAGIAEYYGSNEVGGIAFECEHGSLHVTEEHVLLETVDAEGRAVWEQSGRILVTDLDNHAMPLIRYEIGDVGVLTRRPCRCGRSLLVLQELQGRCQDFLRNSRGDLLPAMFFAEQSRHLRGISAYQLVQQQMDEILFRYVPSGPTAKSEARQIHQAITRQLGEHMRVIHESCAEIPLTPRGKTRLVVGLQ